MIWKINLKSGKVFLVTVLVIFGGCLYAQSPGEDPWTTARIAKMEANRWRPSEMKTAQDFNGQNYDWKYAACYWTIDPAEKYIAGRVEHTIQLLVPADTVRFDLSEDLTVTGVTSGGDELDFVFINEFTLAVLFPQTVQPGQKHIEISYHGVPVNHSIQSFVQGFHGMTPEIYTLSEPYGARDWWPCKQTLNDKLDSIFVEITVPAGNKAGSNGTLGYINVNPDSTLSFGWKHHFPIPAYLVSLAVTNYAEYTQSVTVENKQIPILNYFYPERYEQAVEQVGVVPDLIQTFSSYFGIYPYWQEKYGHCHASLPGGMEHTTMSTMAGFYYSLVAHELAHQWFGDMVTCGSWGDIWLNEGFATFLTGLSYESLFDDEQYLDWKSGLQQSIKSLPGGAVYVTDTLSRERIFDGRTTYNKGAYVLVMLRHIMGDSLFFEACRNYLNDPELAFGYVRTADFRRHLEAVSARDFSEFFQKWIYSEGYPIYELGWTPSPKGVLITLAQTTSHPSVDFFPLPVPVKIVGDHNSMLVNLDNTFSGQQFFVPTTFTVRDIRFDPRLDILADYSIHYKPDADFDPNRVLISPNPANNKIAVSVLNPLFKPELAEIFNDAGKRVLVRKMAGGMTGLEFDISSLASGTYILRLSREGSSRSAGFVVSRP